MKKNILAFPAPLMAPTPATTIDAQLRSAIAGKRLIAFTYNQQSRVAEPHDYGRRNGIDTLLVYQRKKAGNYITGWRSLEVGKIHNLVRLDDTFSGTREQAHQDHLDWDVLYARVE